jgi:hypothetical protein
MDDGADTHQTGFQRHVERGRRKPVIIQYSTGSPQCHDFGVSRRVMRHDRLIPALGYATVITNQHGTNRNFIRCCGPARQPQGMLHPVFIVHADAAWESQPSDYYSHSIVNETFLLLGINGLIVHPGGNTMIKPCSVVPGITL